ncbi:hypothetical protein NMT03_003883 [Vibrio alginolyticus]|uniref:hypothetical protein n=1 Tax=Vibrio alginolyticus TaxID=663 RepID=UPI00215C2B9C|nr:hypothetical protein [Vibrio alginolyticus]EJL6927798.1 hypothetical protein [Vibrio alginolyticus]MCR9320586.1 hypothetical protein [Vibrio alginolyticus]MCR9960340.1 hypothetical protein [Vibrio alginolyticus]
MSSYRSYGGGNSSPYMKVAKKVVSDYFSRPWLQGWQWSIEIVSPDAPSDVDIYVKDVSFGAGSIDSDVKVIGSGGIALPTTSSVGEITMTVRDEDSLVMNEWFDKRLALVKNKDGTINLPYEYVFEIRMFTISSDGTKKLLKSYQVFPTKKGDITWSREEVNTVASFPLVFQKFSSVGKKVF